MLRRKLDEKALLSLSPTAFGDEARRRALDSLTSGDAQLAHDWTKSWISRGGGAWVIDAWLMYVLCSLANGQPRYGAHSMDIALRTWFPAPEDRAVLHWVRARVIHDKLRDPKTAQRDYELSLENTPSWLAADVEADGERCARDAVESRKRKPSFGPAPEFQPTARDFVTGPVDPPRPGTQPSLWPMLINGRC